MAADDQVTLRSADEIEVFETVVLERMKIEFTKMNNDLAELQKKSQSALARLTQERGEELAALKAKVLAEVPAAVKATVQSLESRMETLRLQVTTTSGTLSSRIDKLDQREEVSLAVTSTPSGACCSMSRPDESQISEPVEEDVIWVADKEEAKSVTSVDQLAPELAGALEKCIPSTVSPQELMSPLQLGYFLWQMGQLGIRNARDSRDYAQRIAQSGAEDRVWSETWLPLGREGTLVDFLSEKIQSHLKRERAEQIRADIEKRLLDKKLP